jgi:hypothetical protein
MSARLLDGVYDAASLYLLHCGVTTVAEVVSSHGADKALFFTALQHAPLSFYGASPILAP